MPRSFRDRFGPESGPAVESLMLDAGFDPSVATGAVHGAAEVVAEKLGGSDRLVERLTEALSLWIKDNWPGVIGRVVAGFTRKFATNATKRFLGLD